MKRSGPLQRRTGLRRFAKRRSGLSRGEKERLDRLHRWIIMARAGAAVVTDSGREQWWGVCQWCDMDWKLERRAARPEPAWLQRCHIEPEGQFRHLAHHILNAFAGCTACHIYRWHKSPREAMEFRLELLGPVVDEELTRLARQGDPKRPDDVARVLEEECMTRFGRIP